MRNQRVPHDSPDHWQRWLDRHGPALLLFARQWSATRSDAEDAVQDGFVRFWRTRETARDLLPYLYTCVRSAAMDLGRGQRRRVRREQGTDRRESSAFEFSAERREREAAIEAALNQLPGDQREVVVMKIWGGLTFAEIGQTLGVPLSTAASRYRYALTRLEQELIAEVSS
jgi:RNA polymerase sigma-70 factor (ECF subfamily)